MKRLLLLLFLPFALGACDDGDTSRIETWTVAPEKGVAGIGMGFGHVPAYIVKRDAGSDWEIGPVRIGGFNFCTGYEAHIRIRPVAVYDPTKGDYRVQYRQVTLRSTELKDSEGLPTL